MGQLQTFDDQNLIIGMGTSDDAAVYLLNEQQAAVLTTDFFTPIVDDPYTFGLVAAANALSDVYAMGGQPTVALNIVCFPPNLSLEILGEILRGGADKVREAGAVLAGGHTVEDPEPKYGLAVMGLVHPQRMFTNTKAKVGDLLVLTKPLGIGILNTAIKADLLSTEIIEKTVNTMAYLNKDASQVAAKVGIEGCTDITGFGFLGHALELAEGSGVTLEIWSERIPIISQAIDLAKDGIIPGGAYQNAKHIGEKVRFTEGVPQEIRDIMYDPQTSGGLLISVPEEKSGELLTLLSEKNQTEFSVVGRVKDKSHKWLEVQPNE